VRNGKPLVIDGYCGLGGWSEAFIAEGWECIGIDIERHDYGNGGYPGTLILQDMRTIKGEQFKDADCLVFSPPCTEFSYMAMPWSRAKQIRSALLGNGEFPKGYKGSRTKDELTDLFNQCFRIQREIIAACGHYVPMVIENVRGRRNGLVKPSGTLEVFTYGATCRR
jgi:site-specific DNA-cytosine methylase